MTDTIWPDRVLEYADSVLKAIQDELDPEEVNPEILREELHRALFARMMQDSPLILSEEEFSQVYMLAAVQTTLSSLMERGIVDSIENEEGVPVYWLTSAGKEIVEQENIPVKNGAVVLKPLL